MRSSNTTARSLHNLVRRWQRAARFAVSQDSFYHDILEEALFHARLRYTDYSQFIDEEGEFPVRLERWLQNVPEDKHKKTLLRLLPFILFVDRYQMHALYRDAYRRVVMPWLGRGVLTAVDQLAPDFESKVRSLMAKCGLLTITESFNMPEFLRANSLAGLPKHRMLGEDPSQVAALLRKHLEKDLIIFEDFVGTGKQSQRMLSEVRKVLPKQRRILFVPLIILEDGKSGLEANSNLDGIEIAPVYLVSRAACLRKEEVEGEPKDFGHFRALINLTAERVIEPLGTDDDPPRDAFGYDNQGALLVTYHNSPNNVIPLIHHRAPRWEPLFRRLHHTKG